MKLKLLTTLLESSADEDDPFAERKYKDANEELETLNAKVVALERLISNMVTTIHDLKRFSPSVADSTSRLSQKVGKPLASGDYVSFEFYEGARLFTNLWVYTPDKRAFRTVNRMSSIWDQTYDQIAKFRQRLVTVRASARRATLKSVQQSAPKTTIPIDRIPRVIEAMYGSNIERINNPYFRAPPTGFTVERYAGSPAHFTRWPLKTKASFIDMDSMFRRQGVGGFTTIYAATSIRSTGDVASVRFIMIGAGGNVVWHVDSSANNIDKIYVKTLTYATSSHSFVKYNITDQQWLDKYLPNLNPAPKPKQKLKP